MSMDCLSEDLVDRKSPFTEKERKRIVRLWEKGHAAEWIASVMKRDKARVRHLIEREREERRVVEKESGRTSTPLRALAFKWSEDLPMSEW